MRRAPSKPAFTLIELLVVVAIIALLLAILLPSLRGAKEAARRAVCGTHLRSLLTAWEIYAFDYGKVPGMGRLGAGPADFSWKRGADNQMFFNGLARFEPSSWAEYTAGGWGGPFGMAWVAMGRRAHIENAIFQINIDPTKGYPNADHFGTWQNFGRLFTHGAVKNPKMFHCPSQRNPNYQFNTAENPWPPSHLTAFHPVFTVMANHTDASFQRRPGLSSVPWDRIPLRTMIMSDILRKRVYSDFDDTDDLGSAVEMRECHRTGVNVAHRSGGVTFVRDKPFNDYETGEPRSLGTWTVNDDTEKRDFLQLLYWLDRR